VSTHVGDGLEDVVVDDDDSSAFLVAMLKCVEGKVT